MDDRYRIRTARRSDIAAIAELEHRIFSEPWSAASFRSLLGHHAVVVTRGRTLAGYVFARLAGGEAEVVNLGVHPEARRRGIGRALVSEVLGRLRSDGADVVYLEVRASNSEARALYAELGFADVGLRPTYYRRPMEDAIVMALKMPVDRAVR